jgi:hypothetical protein
MHAPTIAAVAAFGVGLVATLVLAAWLTPRTWWRRPNARALAVLVAGTFGIGSGLLWWFGPAAPAMAAAPANQAMLAAEEVPAAVAYRAYDDLNLRTGTGVSAQRVAVVPAGAPVTLSGARKGDWWEVSAHVGGREVRGWVSSLWLRRVDERVRTP